MIYLEKLFFPNRLLSTKRGEYLYDHMTRNNWDPEPHFSLLWRKVLKF
jgi:hypothetical protein